MDIFNSDYWKLVRILQKAIGYWQFQDKKWKLYVPRIYVYLFTFSFMISMGIRLYNEIGVNVAIVVENVIGEVYLLIVFSKLTLYIAKENKQMKVLVVLDLLFINSIYNIYLYSTMQLKYIYTRIAKDWKIINDEEELKVMHMYTNAGRKIVEMYSAYMIIGVAAFLIMPVTAPLLDYIIPLENATRPKALPYYAEYGVDQEEHYYPLMAQAVFGGVGTITVLVTYDLGFIMIVQHVVALFALVNFRLEKVEKISEMMEKQSVNCITGNLCAYKQTISAIKMHQIVLDYVALVEDIFNLAWLFVLFLNMVMIGGGFAVILLKFERPEEVVRYVIVVGAALIHFYYVFLPGQKIINSSSRVFDACYACKWYQLSGKPKNLLMVMMIRSLRRCELTGGKMFILCMDTYCNMMKSGLSIFTVLKANE